MIQTGVWVLILGLGSFILPMFGFQFRILSIFGDAAPLVGIILTILGIVLLVVGISKNKKPTKVFDEELDKLSGDETAKSLGEITYVKQAKPTILYELLQALPRARTKADLMALVDEFTTKLEVSRNTVMFMIKHSGKVRKIAE